MISAQEQHVELAEPALKLRKAASVFSSFAFGDQGCRFTADRRRRRGHCREIG
jgi:hypothetical protein